MAEPTPGVRDPKHRVDQPCHSCGIYDRHPRHVVVLDMARGMTQVRHFDCCHFAGCPDGSCSQTLKESGNAHGDALIAHLEGRQARG